MSIILDALRRRRAGETPAPNPNAAQTDAVLQTLGYGRFSPATPFNRIKRVLGVLVLCVFLAVLLWTAVAWITQIYLSPTAPPEAAVVPQAAPPPAPRPLPKAMVPPAPQVTPTPAPSAQMPPAAASGSEVGNPVASNSAVTAVAAPPTRSGSAPVAPPARSGAAPNAAATNAPSAPVARDRVIVQSSSRVNVPNSMPTAPTGAPSSSAPSTAAGANSATVTTGDDHFKRAMMYQRLGEFENALVGYRQVLQRDDLNVEAHNNLGVLYRDKGLFDDAIRHFLRAIAINPGYAPARNNLGVVYLTQRRLDMAATQFQGALSLDAKNVESMVNLSTVERESGHREESRRWLMRALVIDPRNAAAHYNFGLIEDEAGNRAEALTHYRDFLKYGSASHPALVDEVRKRIDALGGK